MKLINIFSLTFLLFTVWFGQSITLVTPLEDSLQETSGLLYLNERILSIDDADAPAIHEIDSVSGEITRSVVVNNAVNVDWEDIASDEEYLYIGDIGNNYGKRESLKIYRVAKAEYLNTENDTVTAEIISFTYKDQEDFSSPLFTTNYDAEALVSVGDSLYVFTKNWGDRRTNIYAIPKEPGIHEVEKVDTLDVQGLVTGATYNVALDKVILSGNSLPSPFILELNDFSSGVFSDEKVQRHKIQPPAGYSVQIEGITFVDGSSVYLSAEKNVLGKAALYTFAIPESL